MSLSPLSPSLIKLNLKPCRGLILYFALSLLSISLWPCMAENIFSDEDLSASFEKSDKQELSLLKSNTILKQRDPQTGIFSEDYYTEQDQHRFSLLIHANQDPKGLTDILAFEAIYAHRLKAVWLEFFIQQTKARFGEIAQPTTALGTDPVKQQASQDTINMIGGGIMHRSSWVQNLIDSDKVFTSTSANFSYSSLSDELLQKEFKGAGLKADFGLHRRSSRTMHYGIKMSYHLAKLKRPQEFETETSSQRTLLLTWLTFGFDLSFYF